LASPQPAASTLRGLELGRQLIAARLTEPLVLLSVDGVGPLRISRAICS
jgi:hypothetical protein